MNRNFSASQGQFKFDTRQLLSHDIRSLVSAVKSVQAIMNEESVDQDELKLFQDLLVKRVEKFEKLLSDFLYM